MVKYFYRIKRQFSMLLSIVMILSSILVFSENNTSKVYCETNDEKKTFKILAVGNSLSFDTLFYVYDFAKELGYEDVVVGNLYIGSCSIKRHWNNAKRNRGAYEYKKKYMDYSERNNGKWEVSKGVSIEKGLLDEDWDYVMLSQYSADNGRVKSYKYLNKLVKYVKNRVGDNTKIIWNMIWAFQGDYNHERFAYYNYNQKTMYKKIVRATKKKVIKNADISTIIPSATVIQNARNSKYGDHFTKDGRHLTRKGRYMTGLGLVCRLTGCKVTDIKYRPKKISKRFRRVANKVVKKALDKPMETTTIK